MLLTPKDALYASIAACTWPDISPFTPVPIVERLLSPRLYEHQRNPLTKVAQLMRAGYRRVLLQAATGFGKTVCAESAIASTLTQGLGALFLVHRRELIRQTSNTFTAAGLSHSFVAAGLPCIGDHELLLAGVQTLVRRLDLILPPNLIVVDECHHATSATWTAVLEAFPDAFILGLTATPERLDGQGLDQHFDIMVEGPSIAWLIENQFLSPYEYYAPTIPDMTGVPSIGGDFSREAAAAVVDKPSIIGDIVEHYLRLCPGEQGIVFCSNREHSRHVAEAFIGNGIPAMHVDGSMTEAQRTYFDDSFRAGDTRIGTNCDLFSEGYDVPNISYLGDAAPSRSRTKVAQRRGRPLRFKPGKVAIMCDHAGNAVTQGHGLPDDEVKYSLLSRAARQATGVNDDASPVRQCKVCFQVSRSNVPACPCGEEFPVRSQEIKLKPGQLEKLERAALREQERIDREARKAAEEEARKKAARARKREERECAGFSDFERLAEQRGYDNPKGWARMKMSHRKSYAPG